MPLADESSRQLENSGVYEYSFIAFRTSVAQNYYASTRKVEAGGSEIKVSFIYMMRLGGMHETVSKNKYSFLFPSSHFFSGLF